MKKYIIFAAMVIASFGLQAQVGNYHRIFANSEDGDTTVHHLASDRVSDGTGSFLTRHITGDNKSFVYISTDNKGKLQTKTEVNYGIDTVNVAEHADLVRNHDSIVYATVLEINGGLVPVIGNLHTNGNSHNADQYAGIDFDVAIGNGLGYSNVDDYPDSSFIHSICDKDAVISRFDNDNEFIWSSRYALSDMDGNSLNSIAINLELSEDTIIYSAGLLEDDRPYQLVVDSLGDVVMAKAYTFPGGPSADFNTLASITEQRSVLAGHRGDLSYVMLTDSMGNDTWAKTFQIGAAATKIYAATHALSGDIVVAGKYFPSDSTKLFSAAFGIDGSVKWVNDYGPIIVDTDLNNISLFNQIAAGTSVVVNGINEMGEEGIAFIKQDEEGATPCSSLLMDFNEFDINMGRDTLLTTISFGISATDTVAYELNTYDNIIEPILTVSADQIVFCPNDTIMELLTASVSNVDTSNVMYAWQDGSVTTDTLRAFEEGDYTVTVTVSEDFCYSLCDTIQLTRSELPEVSIVPDFSQVCLTGFANLIADEDKGTSPFTYLWSTGSTDRILSTDQDGFYSVKVYDSCGDSASASIDLVIIQDQIGSDIAVDSSRYCSTGNIFLTLNGASTTGNNDFEYMWSTGEESQTITVNEAGTYSVSVTNVCDSEDNASTVITLPILQGLDFNLNGDLCNPNENTTLMVSPIGGGNDDNLEYSWSTGAESVGITLENPGTYSVTISSEFCGEVSDDFMVEVPDYLRYASVFFPLANQESDTLDQTFGAILSCNLSPESIIDYEFKIFNRWGQEVFATDNVLDKWDATWNGDSVPTEAYVWYALHKVDFDGDGSPDVDNNGATIVEKYKGDVTVIYFRGQ